MVIYSKVKLGVSPDINALASLIICARAARCSHRWPATLMRRAERQRRAWTRSASRLMTRIVRRAAENPPHHRLEHLQWSGRIVGIE